MLGSQGKRDHGFCPPGTTSLGKEILKKISAHSVTNLWFMEKNDYKTVFIPRGCRKNNV